MSTVRTRSSAPIGVKVIAAVAVFDGLLMLLGALGSFLSFNFLWAAVLGAIAIAQLAVAAGLVTLRPYAWTVAMAVFGASLVADLLATDLLGVVVSGALLAYLYAKKDLYGK